MNCRSIYGTLTLPLGMRVVEESILQAARHERVEEINHVFQEAKKDPIAAAVGLLALIAKDV